MLTKEGLRAVPTVISTRLHSDQALILQSCGSDHAESAPDDYRMSHKDYSIYDTGWTRCHNSILFCT